MLASLTFSLLLMKLDISKHISHLGLLLYELPLHIFCLSTLLRCPSSSWFAENYIIYNIYCHLSINFIQASFFEQAQYVFNIHSRFLVVGWLPSFYSWILWYGWPTVLFINSPIEAHPGRFQICFNYEKFAINIQSFVWAYIFKSIM